MTTNDHGKKISEVWVPGEGDAYNHRYQSKDGLELELSATHHGDHDEFWIVMKRDGAETGRINPRQVTEISWEKPKDQERVVEADFARKLERERDEARSDLEFRRDLYKLQSERLDGIERERNEWKAKYIQQNKDLGCEMMDPNGTIWDYAKKVQTDLASMTEQRDRLAEGLLALRNNESFSIGGAAYEIVEQALQSLNQPTKP